jgi:hypothetical protein
MSILYTNRGHFYAPHTRPVLLDCNFIVDPTNGNGFGVRSLKGQGIASLFMHTTATPGRASNGQLNPNPVSGVIQVQFNDNFNRYYGGFSGFVGPVGAPSTSTTAFSINVITVLGTATLAQWLAVGLPPGIVPALGVSFIATSTALIGGGAEVSLSAAGYSGIDHIEAVGDPNTTIGPIPVGGSPNFGGFIYLACLFEGALTAPAAGTAIGLSFYLGQSSVTVKGE